jgi:hypothetical protein
MLRLTSYNAHRCAVETGCIIHAGSVSGYRSDKQKSMEHSPNRFIAVRKSQIRISNEICPIFPTVENCFTHKNQSYLIYIDDIARKNQSYLINEDITDAGNNISNRNKYCTATGNIVSNRRSVCTAQNMNDSCRSAGCTAQNMNDSCRNAGCTAKNMNDSCCSAGCTATCMNDSCCSAGGTAICVNCCKWLHNSQKTCGNDIAGSNYGFAMNRNSAGRLFDGFWENNSRTGRKFYKSCIKIK